MNYFARIFALGFLLAAFSFQAAAQQRQKMERPRMDCQEQMRTNQMNRHQNMMRMLELSDSQRKSIESIHLNGQKSMLAMRNQMQEYRAKLQTLTTADSYDENAVSELVTEISELQASMLSMRLSHRQQIRGLLTEEQRIKFDTHQMRNKGRSFNSNMKKRMNK